MAEFTCLGQLGPLWRMRGVRVLSYQLDAAARMLHMPGGGILADEVGLGKTIEAGLVLRELMAQGMCTTVLVLCPASLCQQWRQEMQQKFALDFTLATTREAIGTAACVIVSLDSAKRVEWRCYVQQRYWDVVVVDEAHRLKNSQTWNYRLVAGLRRGRLILISATPLQNNLTELYALVSLVRPTMFRSFRAFWRQYLLDNRTPRDPEALRALLARIMIRHGRRESGQEARLPARQLAMLPLQLSAQERVLYDALTMSVREEYSLRQQAQTAILPLLTLQREICSSVSAVRSTLYAIDDADWLSRDLRRLRELADGVQAQAKAETLLSLLARLQERALVFTEFRATQEYLAASLRRQGVPVTIFHGGLTSAERARASEFLLREPRAVMVATDSGSEGLNLQACSHVINYDLPWNPMRIEQRIGRVHRVGQAHDVWVHNLFALDTVEEYVLDLLDKKLNLFRSIIGETDVIIGTLRRQASLEGRIAKIIWQSHDIPELRWRFEELGRSLLRACRVTATYDQLLHRGGVPSPCVPQSEV